MIQVSVVIPSYNRSALLMEAVTSVLKQTYSDYEIVIVDDGSTDDTKRKIDDLGSTAIKYVYKVNGGLSSARNCGIRESSGEYIAFLDSDDMWHPEKLAKQVRVLRANPTVDVVYCDFNVIDQRGLPMQKMWQKPDSRASLYEDLMYGNVIAGSGSSVLAKRSCFNSAGIFDENLSAIEDQDMWRRLALNYSFYYIDEVLVSIRMHAGNMQLDSRRMVLANLRHLSKMEQETPEVYRYHLPELRRQATRLLRIKTLSRPFGTGPGLLLQALVIHPRCALKALVPSTRIEFMEVFEVLRRGYMKYMPEPIKGLWRAFKRTCKKVVVRGARS